MSDGVCTGFEPQNYLRDRCKKCFRLRSKHGLMHNTHTTIARTTTVNSPPTTRHPTITTLSPTTSSSSPIPTSTITTTTVTPKKEKRRSWRDKTHNHDEGPENEIPDQTDTVSISSFKSATSRGLSSAKSLESVASNMDLDSKSMVTAVSSEFTNDDERATTPTEASDLNNAHLNRENARLHEEIAKLKEERERWTLRRSKKENEGEQSLIDLLEERLIEAENLIQDYRDENTVLKCELREIQDNPSGSSETNQPLSEKLKATESLCEEMMIENENLKADIKDLQQEIEEMQDQYREEEIEEFRELQRELEQNAKNCRVLQFKFRKAERLREQLEIENAHVLNKLKAFRSKDENENTEIESARTKELESELRIAKEVSVRLHNELEAAEDKRYKMEDEIFYLKEKIRELQTQNKWREARNKAEQIAKRQSLELTEISMSAMSGDDLTKELRDVLERETDLREQLRFTEEDLKRTQNRLQEVENENEDLLRKLTKLTESGGRISVGSKQRPPMTRSISDGNPQLKLEMATAELEQLNIKVEEFERKNTALTKKMLEMEIDMVKKLQDRARENNELDAEITKDIGRFMSTIHELEKKNSELQRQLDKKTVEGSQNGHVLTNKEKSLTVELRNEQEKHKELETNLSEYKALISKSDNQKLISMATKVELLTNQLALAQERCNMLHRKSIKEGGGDEKYVDTLKQRCETLEKQLSEQKASQIFHDQHQSNEKTGVTIDEIEQCCVVLASVEAQTNRICKQMEKLDTSQQKDERRRSMSKDTSATMIAELANVMSELKFLHQVLDAHKITNDGEKRLSPKRELSLVPCKECKEKDEAIQATKQEISFYKKKNTELTNQIIETENRWTVEIEKQTYGLKSQVRSLENQLAENKGVVEEQTKVIDSQNASLSEKDKVLQEVRQKCTKLQTDIQEKQRFVQEMEKDQRNLKEWEIKYKKLEELFDKDKEKVESERNKFRTDISGLKKKVNETTTELEALKSTHQQRELKWKEEQENYEKNISNLKEKLDKLKQDEENNDENISIPVQTINYRVTRRSSKDGIPELKEKITQLEKKNEELELKIMELKIKKEDLETEMSKCKQSWEREKESLLHKVRQDEKVRGVEIDALQQKFTSRMNIMENTNKSLHSQLAQVRRERDVHRETAATYEKKMEDETKRLEADQKKYTDLLAKTNELEKKVADYEMEIHRLTSELALTREAHKADKKLWLIEKNHYSRSKSPSSSEGDERDRRITEDALSAAETVQKQYAEYQKFYSQEVTRLNNKIKELTHESSHKDVETNRMLKELNEQIKVLEIDQRNLLQAKEMQTNAREVLQADQERLLQIVQQTEIQKLSRKYKISAIIDQLNGFGQMSQIEEEETLANILNQLNSIKEDDSQNVFTSNDINEIEPTIDTISQSSLSIRSAAYPPIPHSNRYKFQHSHSLMTPNQRSYSIESNSTWDSRLLDPFRGSSPIKKLTAYPDPPPNFILNKDKVVEYDKDGRLHYVPKCFARSASYDRGVENGSSLNAPSVFVEKATCTDDDDFDFPHSRTSSTGTNILYKIRREELSKGGPPSVKMIAKAFESLEKKDKPASKRGFFNIRKSRSVDTNDGGVQKGLPPHPMSTMGLNTLSTNTDNDSDDSKYATIGGISRGGRNPFKNMGTRLVDRVRRSLSRSGRKSRDRSLDSVQQNGSKDERNASPEKPAFEKPPIKATPITPVKVKTKIKKSNDRITKKPTPT